MSRKLAFVTFGIYLFIAGVIYSFTSLREVRSVRASVYPRVVTINDTVTFADSTRGAKEVLWEFGNGDQSKLKHGAYQFKNPGRYMVRVTINGSHKDTFLVSVNNPPRVIKKDSSIFIYANRSGIVNQKIHFKAMGGDIEWCEWYFSGTGKVDSREIETFYAFNKVGTFDVKLVTNLNEKSPKIISVTILPEYKVTENVVLQSNKDKGGGGKSADEFKDKLQAIANGSNFNINYNYLVKKYLCSNPRIPVVINGKASSDFYSYCQGLQINSGITIDKATPEINAKTNCASKIIIVQH